MPQAVDLTSPPRHSPRLPHSTPTTRIRPYVRQRHRQISLSDHAIYYSLHFTRGFHPSRDKTLCSNSTLSHSDIFIIPLKIRAYFLPGKWGAERFICFNWGVIWKSPTALQYLTESNAINFIYFSSGGFISSYFIHSLCFIYGHVIEIYWLLRTALHSCWIPYKFSDVLRISSCS